MSQRRISRLPVVDASGAPVGIATFSNISRVMQQLASDIFSGWDRSPASASSTRDPFAR